MLKGVIFDMDGVIINSEPVHYEAYRQVLEELGCEEEYTYEIYQKTVGSTQYRVVEEIINRFGLTLSVEEIQDRGLKKQSEIFKTEGYPPVPGAVELIRKLHNAGLKLAVASSSVEALIEESIRGIGVTEYFDRMVSADTLDKPKPEPDVFLLAAQELGLSPDECIIIEDSENGVLAAKAAGIPCVGYINPDSGKQDLSAADILVEGFEEIDEEFMVRVWKRAHGEP